MTPVQFMLLAQVIIFLLGWPLEWTEIIIIFMPIFIPLLAHFNIDPLFFGLLVALNLQTAFLSPPVAMAAFYLKGVSPPHVTLNQIFLGMLPFMAIQMLAIFLLYMFPQIGLWIPSLLYADGHAARYRRGGTRPVNMSSERGSPSGDCPALPFGPCRTGRRYAILSALQSERSATRRPFTC